MNSLESLIQTQCVTWFRLQHPNDLIFAVPNGGSRNLLEARKLKREGVMAGVSDLIVIQNNRIVFIEMKHEKGRQSKSQKEFENKVSNLGYEYHLCRSFGDFKTIVESR